MATRLKFAPDAAVNQPAENYTTKSLVDVYDPKSDQLLHADKATADELASVGYKVGPEAQLEADLQGPLGKMGALGGAALRALTLGASDEFLPKSIVGAEDAAQHRHPGYELGGELLGGAAWNLNPVSTVASSAARGAIDAAANLRRRNEPLQAEALLHGLGWGALTGLVAVGAGKLIHKGLPAGLATVEDTLNLTRSSREVTSPIMQTRYADVWKGEAPLVEREAGSMLTPEENNIKVALGRNPGEEATRQGRLTRLTAAMREPSAVSGGEVSTLPFDVQVGEQTSTAYGAPLSHPLVDWVPGMRTLRRPLRTFLSQKEEISAAVDEISDKFLTKVGKSVQNLFTGGAATVNHEKELNFEDIQKHVNDVAVSPDAVAEYVQRTYGPLADAQISAMGLASAKALQTNQKLHEALPKSQQMMTALPIKPFVPQVAKMRFMGYYKGITDFGYALENPTPDIMEFHREVNPALMAYTNDLIMAKLQAMDVNKLTLRQRRVLSTILGVPLTPENTPEFLDTIHSIAATPDPKPEPKKPGSTASQKASLRDAPKSELPGFR